jgi:hypothetical protein
MKPLLKLRPGRRMRLTVEAKKILEQNRRILQIKKELGLNVAIKGGNHA